MEQTTSTLFADSISPAIGSASPTIIQLQQLWKTVDTLWAGTSAMRLAGKLYLPQEPMELDENYASRLSRSTLYNAYRQTIQSAVARVFSRDIHIEACDPNTAVSEATERKEKLPFEMASFVTDVDNQGRNITQFCKSVFEDAINHGVSYILVDYMRMASEFPTLADQQSSASRPYWVHVAAPTVLDARSTMVNGAQRLSLFRYQEFVNEIAGDGITYNTYQQVRVFRQEGYGPVEFAVYRAQDQKDAQWLRVDSGIMEGIGAIPVIPVYTNRTAFYLGKPVLQDLADLNIHHWQVMSDYTNITHVCAVPFLFTKGLKAQMNEDGEQQQISIDVRQGVVALDSDADIKWIETNGNAIAALRDKLKDVEIRMERLGLQLTSPVVHGGTTATANALNASESNSMLKSMALALSDSINAALFYTAQFLGVKPNAKAIVNLSYSTDYANDNTTQYIMEAFKEGVIDAATCIQEFKRRNVIDPFSDVKPAEVKPAESKPVEEKPVGVEKTSDVVVEEEAAAIE